MGASATAELKQKIILSLDHFDKYPGDKFICELKKKSVKPHLISNL